LTAVFKISNSYPKATTMISHERVIMEIIEKASGAVPACVVPAGILPLFLHSWPGRPTLLC